MQSASSLAQKLRLLPRNHADAEALATVRQDRFDRQIGMVVKFANHIGRMSQAPEKHTNYSDLICPWCYVASAGWRKRPATAARAQMCARGIHSNSIPKCHPQAWIEKFTEAEVWQLGTIADDGLGCCGGRRNRRHQVPLIAKHLPTHSTYRVVWLAARAGVRGVSSLVPRLLLRGAIGPARPDRSGGLGGT